MSNGANVAVGCFIMCLMMVGMLALVVSTTLHLWWVLSVVPGFTTLFFPVLSWTVINGLIVLSVYIINCIIEASK